MSVNSLYRLGNKPLPITKVLKMTKAKDAPAKAKPISNEPTNEAKKLSITDLKATTQIDIILELVREHKYNGDEAKAFYKKHHKAVKKANLTATFFKFIRSNDLQEAEVETYVLANGGSEKTNLAYFKNCASAIAYVRATEKAKAEPEAEPEA